MSAVPENPEGKPGAALPEAVVHDAGHESGPKARHDETGEPLPPEASSQPNGIATAVWILTVIAVVAALYLARAFFVPLLFGILVSYTLGPLVDGLERWRIPRVIGAALVLAVAVGGVSWMAVSLSDDAGEIVDSLPDAARKLRQSLHSLHAGEAGVIQQIQKAADELQRAAADAGLESPKAAVVVSGEPEGIRQLRDFLLAQSALLVSFATQTPVVLLLTYFLLASGTHFRRKLVTLAGPSLSRKKDVVRLLEEVHVQVQRYLLVLLISNTVIAVLTWLAFEAFGLEHAGVFGVAAGILRFIPYLGALAVIVASAIAALLQFGSIPVALAIVATSLVISAGVGLVLTTWLQGRFARVNAAVLFIVLLFFGWLWGAAGLLLGAPLLAIAKVVCDNVEPLKPIGEMLGR